MLLFTLEMMVLDFRAINIDGFWKSTVTQGVGMYRTKVIKAELECDLKPAPLGERLFFVLHIKCSVELFVQIYCRNDANDEFIIF